MATVDMSLELLLGPQLRAFAEAGLDVRGVSAPGPYVAGLEGAGIPHIALRHATRAMAPAEDALALAELVRLFRRLRPDVVHTHTPKPGWYGRPAARLAGVPAVVNTVHGIYASPADTWRRRLPVYALERGAAAFSDAELVQNPEDVETLRRLRVPDRRLHLLGNGVDLDRFSRRAVDPAAVARVRAELAGTDDPEVVVVGAVGRLVWEKGLAELVEAATSLRASSPHVVVAVVGPPEADKADGLRAEDLPGIEARSGVRFVGARDDMPEVYAAMDAYVLASHREGYPRSAMEAAAMGLPVVATDIRGCRQVVDDGVTGTLVPVRDGPALARALAALAGDAGTRRAMGAAAVARAHEHFDQARLVEITLRCYRDLGVPVPAGRAT
ncbi:glycosyltransferase family 4 protein [Iamia majanohamensis]|uniref:Glycosyltransferase family 4 protein n=1 Tax=Iamia majanohamensis TaxID=467976 RepID=A0AAF0BSU8_9ACTN|nr:glycosyltransferase family 4 protein [Iamia majanohamensis]WCO65857.1 glycosyltransferase family 4 protein [Iamia majanohamensis]